MNRWTMKTKLLAMNYDQILANVIMIYVIVINVIVFGVIVVGGVQFV